MNKKYLIGFLIIIVLLIGVLYILFPTPQIKPVNEEVDLSNLDIKSTSNKNHINTNVLFFNVRAPKGTKSVKVDLYKSSFEGEEKYEGFGLNFEQSKNKPFKIGVGTFLDIPILFLDDSFITLKSEILENSFPVSGYYSLKQNISPSKFNEPIILKFICFSNNGMRAYITHYLKDFKIDKGFEYVFFTITFYN